MPPPILANKEYHERSLFEPEALLREARRQKRLVSRDVPELCVLDPDGDIVRRLRERGAARRSPVWACYHTDLYDFEVEGRRLGIIGCAVGASFAVLVAEQLFASGCRLVVSITSAGQVAPVAAPPYFVLIDRALRDEGTSYHYLAASDFAEADRALIDRAAAVFAARRLPAIVGSSWTTDAPFRETEGAVAGARARGILAVEMEAAALYAFAEARRRAVLCLAYVTNAMGQSCGEFEKGEADGTTDALEVIGALAQELIGHGDALPHPGELRELG